MQYLLDVIDKYILNDVNDFYGVKIYNPVIKKYMCRGRGWNDTGKIWNKLAHAKTALYIDYYYREESFIERNIKFLQSYFIINIKNKGIMRIPVYDYYIDYLSRQNSNEAKRIIDFLKEKNLYEEYKKWRENNENKKINNYMAIIRNLRNILNANVSQKHLDKVMLAIEHKQAVKSSKLLPFRFFSAYQELQSVPKAGTKVFDVLETALEYSVENMQKISGTTVIAIDTSGSMGGTISNNSSIRCADIARLLAVLATKICDNAIIYTFDSNLKKQSISTRNGIIETAMNIPFNGGSTLMQLPLEEMINKEIKADRLIMFSDNVINNSWYGYKDTCEHLASKYRKEINPNLWTHAIDLQGYGTQQFDGARTNIIAGWSEKILDFISLAETDRAKQVEMIENYGEN